MTIDWYGRYVTRMNNHYRKHMANYYQPFFHILSQQAPATASVAEFGCGAANVSRILAEQYFARNYHYLLLDNCLEMLQLASNNMCACYGAHFEVINHDMRKTAPAVSDVGLIYSHGVLEHFPDDEIRSILMHQRAISNRLVHYVPTDHYEAPSFGDERLLPAQYWVDTFRPDTWCAFNEGKDLVLIWKQD